MRIKEFINLIIVFYGLALINGCSSNNTFLEQGMSQLKKNEFNSAIKSFREGLANNPEQPELYYYGLANCYYYMENYEFATREIENVIAIDNNHRDSYWLMARIYSKEGELKKSIEYFSKAISIGSNSMLLASRGYTYIELEEYKLALKDLNNAINQNPNDKFALSNRGLLEVKLKMFQEAKIDLQKSMQIDENNPYVYKHLALLNLAILDTVKACYYLHISKEKGYFSYGNEIDKNEVNKLIEKHCQ